MCKRWLILDVSNEGIDLTHKTKYSKTLKSFNIKSKKMVTMLNSLETIVFTKINLFSRLK